MATQDDFGESNFEVIGADGAGDDAGEDPTADFIAREREQMAALQGGDDFGGFGDAPPSGDAGAADDDFAAFEGGDTSAGAQGASDPFAAGATQDDGFGEFDSGNAGGEAQPAAATNGGFDDFGGEASADFGGDASADFGGDASADFGGDTTNGAADYGAADFSSAAPPMQNGGADYGAVNQMIEEPESLRKVREQREHEIAERDADEEIKVQELKSEAMQALEDFYKKYQQQIEKNRENNRKSEQAFVDDRDAQVPGKEWEKIVRMVDFNPKTSKVTKDTSRMRNIFLKLKSDGN
eukprot:Clim_evm18s70 gene=Clim_evmTU18s70